MSKSIEIQYLVTTRFPVDREIRELDKQIADTIDWQEEDLSKVKIERVLSDLGLGQTTALVMNKTEEETIMPVPCAKCGELINICVRADRKPHIFHSECFENRNSK